MLKLVATHQILYAHAVTLNNSHLKVEHIHLHECEALCEVNPQTQCRYYYTGGEWLYMQVWMATLVCLCTCTVQATTEQVQCLTFFSQLLQIGDYHHVYAVTKEARTQKLPHLCCHTQNEVQEEGQ